MMMLKQIVALGVLFLSLNAFAMPNAYSLPTSYSHNTKSGIQYNILKQGSGKTPTINDEVEIRFTSYTSQGEVLDGTLNQVPMILPIDGTFSGLQQSLLLMPAGSIYEFNIPAHFGYTEEGKANKQAVRYRIELLRINP